MKNKYQNYYFIYFLSKYKPFLMTQYIYTFDDIKNFFGDYITDTDLKPYSYNCYGCLHNNGCDGNPINNLSQNAFKKYPIGNPELFGSIGEKSCLSCGFNIKDLTDVILFYEKQYYIVSGPKNT